MTDAFYCVDCKYWAAMGDWMGTQCKKGWEVCEHCKRPMYNDYCEDYEK